MLVRVFSFLIVVAGTLFSTPKDYLLVSTKQFTVQGTTSIGGFECNYDLKTKDTLFFNSPYQTNVISHSIPVRNFGCGNFLLNNDFRKTLKEKEYPTIKIILSNFKKEEEKITCNLTINLVGKKRVYKQLPLKLNQHALQGEVLLNISDFDLEPPKKMGGIIKINEEIKLVVNLKTE